jgi:hypothetical protein
VLATLLAGLGSMPDTGRWLTAQGRCRVTGDCERQPPIRQGGGEVRFLRLCDGDPVVEYLRSTFGANIVRIPRASLRRDTAKS